MSSILKFKYLAELHVEISQYLGVVLWEKKIDVQRSSRSPSIWRLCCLQKQTKKDLVVSAPPFSCDVMDAANLFVSVCVCLHWCLCARVCVRVCVCVNTYMYAYAHVNEYSCQ